MAWESSYGYARKDEDGWDHRYYYSYYTTLGGRSTFPIVLETMMYAFVFFASVTANLSILLAILMKKSAHTVTNCFILNLAFVDLVLISSTPVIAVARASESWNLGTFLCKMVPFSQVTGGAILLWTLTGISIDRRYCLEVAPYKLGFSRRTVIIALSAIWIICVFMSSPVAVFFREQKVMFNYTHSATNHNSTKDYYQICTMVFPRSDVVSYAFLYTITILFLFLIIPMCILVCNYVKIYKKLKEIQDRLEVKLDRKESVAVAAAHSVKDNLQLLVENMKIYKKRDNKHNTIARRISTTEVRLEKHKRSIKILYTNVTAMLIMWTPITIVLFMIYMDGHYKDNGQFILSNQHFIWAVVCCLLNTMINPIIYGFLTENFKHHFPTNVLLEHCMKREESTLEDVNADTNSNATSSQQRVRIVV